MKRKDASKILRGKKKLKTTNLSQNDFPHNNIGFINESLSSYYMFFGNSVKNYNPKDPLHHSGSQMGLFKLKKVKTIPQYWFHTSPT